MLGGWPVQRKKGVEFQDSESGTGGSWGLLCFPVLTFVGGSFSPRCLKGLRPRSERPLVRSFSGGKDPGR